MEVRLECGIRGRGRFPWITSSDKVEKNDAEGPYVIEGRRVRPTRSKAPSLALLKVRQYVFNTYRKGNR